jgi:hypothetical protein
MKTTSRKATLGFLILAGFLLATNVHADPVVVTTGKIEGVPGKEVEVPITLKGVKNVKGIPCMSIRLSYDPQVLTFKSLDKGPVLPNALFDKSIDEKADPGMLGLGFACGSKTPGGQEMAEVDSDGVVLKVIFTINEKAEVGKKTVLKLDNYRVLDNQDPPFVVAVRTDDGEITFTSAGGPGLGIPTLWIYIGIGIALFLILLLLLFAGRRRAPAQTAPAGATAGTTVPPRFTPEATTFAHKCVKCGGTINLPAAMAGQSFQCGACETTQIAKP